MHWALSSAALVAIAFAAAGCAWWEAYPVIVDLHWDGIASRRPFSRLALAQSSGLLALRVLFDVFRIRQRG
ncbi:MAG: hypothetical protein ACOH1J_05105 [Microbacteriaceae bacterium]